MLVQMSDNDIVYIVALFLSSFCVHPPLSMAEYIADGMAGDLRFLEL